MTDVDTNGTSVTEAKPKGRHSRWAMAACCLPMLAVGVVVFLIGGGLRVLAVGLICGALMMVLMARMAHDHEGH